MTTGREPGRPGKPVPRYARVDVIGGAVMLFVAALVWYGSIGLRVGGIVNFGPGAVPKVLAAVLFAGGLVIFLHGLFQEAEAAEPVSVALRPPAVLALAILVFAFFIKGGDFGFVTTPRLGLAVVGPVTVFVAGFATPEAKPAELAVLAFGLTSAALLVFADLLGVPIPVLPGAVEALVPPSFGPDAAVRAVYAIYAVLAAGIYVTFFRTSRRSRDRTS